MTENLLKQAREARSINQGQLAELLGISAGRLSRIESGQDMPNLVLRARMATVLGFPLAELFHEVEAA